MPPLGLPEDGSVRAVAASEAGSLLVARARAASPAFTLTAGNSAAIAELCSRLDGMPLAIELAAARCPALGPAQLAARLEGHPGLLAGGTARPGRHRSLEALVSWSYELLDEAANLTEAHPDRFTETIVRALRARLFATLGRLDAAETEVGLCWAAGRGGAVRLVEFVGPICEARLAAARGDATAAVGALRRAADGGHRVGTVMFVPAALVALACVAAIAGDESTAAAAVGEAHAALGGRRQAITAAALVYAEGIMAWHRGELADAEHLIREATVQWHRGSDRMDACDGIELLGVIAAARERFTDAARLLAAVEAARPPLQYLAPGFTANRDAAAHTASQARNVLGDDRFTQAWDEGQGLTLDDAVAYAARKGGGRKRPPPAGPA